MDNKHLPLGRLVITMNAQATLYDMDIGNALDRHINCDWGEVCKADWQLNNNALKNGDRILSAYTGTDGNTFWIITESDRSYTTILLPSDY